MPTQPCCLSYPLPAPPRDFQQQSTLWWRLMDTHTYVNNYTTKDKPTHMTIGNGLELVKLKPQCLHWLSPAVNNWTVTSDVFPAQSLWKSPSNSLPLCGRSKENRGQINNRDHYTDCVTQQNFWSRIFRCKMSPALLVLMMSRGEKESWQRTIYIYIYRWIFYKDFEVLLLLFKKSCQRKIIIKRLKF